METNVVKPILKKSFRGRRVHKNLQLAELKYSIRVLDNSLNKFLTTKIINQMKIGLKIGEAEKNAIKFFRVYIYWNSSKLHITIRPILNKLPLLAIYNQTIKTNRKVAGQKSVTFVLKKGTENSTFHAITITNYLKKININLSNIKDPVIYNL